MSLLADFFGNFCNMRLKLSKFHLAHFISAPGLARQAALKNKSKFKMINMSLMV